MPSHVLPPRLRPGDIVGVASPSGAVLAPRRLQRGVAALRALGFQVRIGAMAEVTDPLERDPRRRADELNRFFRDPSVRAVLMTTGGYTSNGVLDLLDYATLRADPKIIVGYSDLTAVLAAVRAEAGLATFHGPTLLPEFAEFPSPQPYTLEHFQRAVTVAKPLGRLVPAPAWSEELLVWDQEDDRPRRTAASDGWRWLSDGTAAGPLAGGNLDTMCALAGTPYLPDFTGSVFFWESASGSLDQIDRGLNQLRMLGVFDKAVGMLVGRSFRGGHGFEWRLERLLGRRFAGFGRPIITGMDLGHTDPMLTLPLEARVALDSATGDVEVLDAAVV